MINVTKTGGDAALAFSRKFAGVTNNEVVEHLLHSGDAADEVFDVGRIVIGLQDPFETNATLHATHDKRRKI